MAFAAVVASGSAGPQQLQHQEQQLGGMIHSCRQRMCGAPWLAYAGPAKIEEGRVQSFEEAGGRGRAVLAVQAGAHGNSPVCADHPRPRGSSHPALLDCNFTPDPAYAHGSNMLMAACDAAP